MKSYKIAVIPGDGIGKEVVPEGIRVLDAAAGKFGLAFDWQHFDWSCQLYTRTGRMMPEDGLEQIRHHDAIFLGAVGFPGVPECLALGIANSYSPTIPAIRQLASRAAYAGYPHAACRPQSRGHRLLGSSRKR